MYLNRGSNPRKITKTGYRLESVDNGISFHQDSTESAYPVFDGDVSPVSYRLSVESYSKNNNFSGTNDKPLWLVGRLYDRSGPLEEVGRPFFTLSVCLGY